jgi:hypothetical protein
MGTGAYIGFWWGDPSERDQLDDIGVDGMNYLLTPYSRVLLEKLNRSQLVKKFHAIIVPEGSLPHSQEPATCPYPEPARSSPCLVHIPLPANPG